MKKDELTFDTAFLWSIGDESQVSRPFGVFISNLVLREVWVTMMGELQLRKWGVEEGFFYWETCL